MPFEAGSFAGVAMIDVLHHLQRPLTFFREAARVLRPGGRLAMIEPGMSALSRVFYDRFHQEPVDMSADAFQEDRLQSGSDPFDSNQAIPTLMFLKPEDRRRVEAAVPGMRVADVRWLSLLAYPLCGGFKPWSAIPAGLVKPVLAVEEPLLKLVGPLAAFRLMIVMEKA